MRAALASVKPTRAGAAAPKRRVGARRDRDADAGETQDQFIGLLASGEALALAHRVADIAEDEKIAERGARERRHVVRFAGDEAARETFRLVARGGGLRGGRIHLLRPGAGSIATLRSARKVDETLREIRIVGGKRRLDFAPATPASNCPSSA